MTDILFAATTIDQFEVIGSAVDAAAGVTTWTPVAINVSGTDTNIARTPDLGEDLTDHWFHWTYESGAYDNGTQTAKLWAADNSNCLRIACLTGRLLKFQYWNGSTWTDVSGTTTSDVGTGTKEFDWYVRLTTTGEISLYVDKVLRLTVTGDFSGYPVPRKFSVSRPQSNFSINVQQYIVARIPTIGFKFKYNHPTGNGANTAWVNDYTAVDENVLSRTDNITSDTADQVETFTAAARTFTGYLVKAVVVNFDALKGITGPQNIQAALRKGGVDYFSSTISLGYGYQGKQAIFETDPSTSAEWTPADAGDAALEFGVKSIA